MIPATPRPSIASQKSDRIRRHTAKKTSRDRTGYCCELIGIPTNTASPEHIVVVEQKVVNLALQGGGSHGAFTWGVLDRLLQEERLSFEGITASSAGSVNAAVLAYGLAVGGRDGARSAERVATLLEKNV
jgi:predicted acylesterase/phospholipase RssA